MGAYDKRVYFADQRNFRRILNYIKMPGGTGVTQVKFNDNGKQMLIGARRDNSITLWDIRYIKQAIVKCKF